MCSEMEDDETRRNGKVGIEWKLKAGGNKEVR